MPNMRKMLQILQFHCTFYVGNVVSIVTVVSDIWPFKVHTGGGGGDEKMAAVRNVQNVAVVVIVAIVTSWFL